MRPLPAGRVAPRFWERVRQADRRLLMLDYDGTLAPFRIDRGNARPLPGVAPLLRAIASRKGDSLAVVSGRPLADLARFLGRLPIPLAAENGWEIRLSDGRVRRYPLPRRARAGLSRAAARAEAAGLGGRLERKRTALVLHTRGLSRARAGRIERRCARLWKAAASGAALRLGRVSGGIELRAAARGKGSVVRELLARSPAGTLPVYLGDGGADEEAFRAVLPRGLALRVGPPGRKSSARGRIPSVAGVRRFLRLWLAILGGGGLRKRRRHE